MTHHFLFRIAGLFVHPSIDARACLAGVEHRVYRTLILVDDFNRLWLLLSIYWQESKSYSSKHKTSDEQANTYSYTSAYVATICTLLEGPALVAWEGCDRIDGRVEHGEWVFRQKLASTSIISMGECLWVYRRFGDLLSTILQPPSRQHNPISNLLAIPSQFLWWVGFVESIL